jgi:hypothetical protein
MCAGIKVVTRLRTYDRTWSRKATTRDCHVDGSAKESEDRLLQRIGLKDRFFIISCYGPDIELRRIELKHNHAAACWQPIFCSQIRGDSEIPAGRVARLDFNRKMKGGIGIFGGQPVGGADLVVIERPSVDPLSPLN